MVPGCTFATKVVTPKKPSSTSGCFLNATVCELTVCELPTSSSTVYQVQLISIVERSSPSFVFCTPSTSTGTLVDGTDAWLLITEERSGGEAARHAARDSLGRDRATPRRICRLHGRKDREHIDTIRNNAADRVEPHWVKELEHRQLARSPLMSTLPLLHDSAGAAALRGKAVLPLERDDRANVDGLSLEKSAAASPRQVSALPSQSVTAAAASWS